jgi:hypothetical protein
LLLFIAFSSEVDTGSREENASKQKAGAPALIPAVFPDLTEAVSHGNMLPRFGGDHGPQAEGRSSNDHRPIRGHVPG